MSKHSRVNAKARRKKKKKIKLEKGLRIFNMLPIKQEINKSLSTQESLAKSKKQIYKDKSNHYKKSILNIKSSTTSQVVSTFNVKGYRSYYNSQVKEWSNKLYVPTEIDCVDLHLNSSNTFSDFTKPNLWFTVKKKIKISPANCPKTFSPSTQYSSVECKEDEQQKTEKEELNLTTNKIRLYFNQQQKQKLKQMISSCRLIFNIVTAHFKNTGKVFKHPFYRRIINEEIANNRPYLKDVPYNSRDGAILSAIWSIKSGIELKKNYPKRKCGIPFKKKKSITQVLSVRAQNIKEDLKIYPGILFSKKMHDGRSQHMQKIRKNNNFDPTLERRDSVLKWNKKLDHWYLCLVQKRESENQVINVTSHTVSIDPGNRTFATLYSPTKGLTKIGENDGERLIKLCLEMDKLYRLKKDSNRQRKKNLDKAINRLRDRLNNLRTDFHTKTASWLCKEYDTIIIPIFNTHLMSKKKERRINKKTVRGLLTWGHGMFRKKLEAMCKARGKNLIYVSEAYTSKTCSMCGWIDEKLSGKEIFKCRNCIKNIDRDVNGARGIYLRALLDGALFIE